MKPAYSESIQSCKYCGQTHFVPELLPGWAAQCRRCGSTIVERKSMHHFTGAFALAALLLYGPANVFPVLQLDMYGAMSENTVWQGCTGLYHQGDYFIALIVFLASMIIPFLKILGLCFLVITTHWRWRRWRRARTWIFRFIDSIGRWAMLDVFALAILVSLVKLQRLATIIPGKGALAFALVVIFTLLASQTFDPKQIWPQQEEKTTP